MQILIPVFYLLFLAPFQLALADDQSLRLWGGGAFNSSSISGIQYSGEKIQAGVHFPAPPEERQSLRISASRVFDSSTMNRYSFLAHIGYRILGPLEIAFLGGVGFLEDSQSGGTYLKPVIGAELMSPLFNHGRSTVSAFASYEVFQGTTGSIALDGGSDALTTRSFSVGLGVSFDLFRDPPTIEKKLVSRID